MRVYQPSLHVAPQACGLRLQDKHSRARLARAGHDPQTPGRDNAIRRVRATSTQHNGVNAAVAYLLGLPLCFGVRTTGAARHKPLTVKDDLALISSPSRACALLQA